MAHKKETLKFTRIQARAEYTEGGAGSNFVSGYLNKYSEFSKFDVELTQDFADNNNYYTQQQLDSLIDTSNFLAIGNDAPYQIFAGKGDYKSEYDAKTLAFVIDGVHIPYDRRIHNLLLNFSSQIWVLLSNGQLKNIVSGKTKEYIQARDRNRAPTLIFRINPTNIVVGKKKLFRKIRTRGGFVFQHWGPDIGNITIKGTTGSLIPDTSLEIQTKRILGVQVPIFVKVSDDKPTEINSPALKAFRQLETWYDEDQGEDWVKRGYLTALEYRGRAYIGHFAEFEIVEKGTQPYQFYYTIKFQIHYDSSHLQAAVTRASNQIVRNQESIATIRAIKQTKPKALNK